MPYNQDQASAYGTIPFAGSSYEVSLLPALRTLGDLAGMAVLDFGAGTGRTALALRAQGAGLVVGVDISRTMLSAAQAADGVHYLQVGTALPLRDAALDAAICANVLCEYSALEAIEQSCREIARVLRTGAPFVAVVTNPGSVRADYLSYRYLPIRPLTSGDKVTCRIKGADPFEITDYYWTRQDYLHAIRAAGFTIVDVLEPVADPADGVPWLDEKTIAPDLVIHTIRR